MRWLAAGVTAWLFADAAWHVPARAGVSTFGDPPVQAAVWAAVGIGWTIALLSAPDRLATARRVALALMLTTLLGQHGVPADPGLRLVLLGVTLLGAAPFLRASGAAWGAAAACALAVPGLLGGVYPQGALLWLAFALPPIALAWLLPSLFPGQAARSPVHMLVAATAAFALLSLWSYSELSDGLDLPLGAVLATRLRVMGLHPNLAVPHLVVTLVLGTALAFGVPGPARMRRLLLLVPVIAALLAVRSRTGLAAALAGLALLWLTRKPGRTGRILTGLAAAVVVSVLALPATGLADARIGRRSSSMVDKSVSFRSAMWALGRRTVAAAPLYGNGPGTTYLQAAHALPGPLDGYPKDDHPHSVVLAVAEALGWPGVLGLALLLALGLRRPREGDLLGAACRVGVLVLFASNAMDLGGAQNTLYPALAFLLLGLADARRAGPEREATRARAVAIPAVTCAALGLVLWAGAAAERRTGEALDRVARATPEQTTRRADALADARSALARADRFAPFSPGVPLLRARLAGLTHDPDAEVAALEAALLRLPRSATLAHRLAVARSRVAPDDPRVDARLADALRWDPYGIDAWRRHMDRCRVALLRGQIEPAREALVTALLLNPWASTEAPTRGLEADMVLHPVGLDRPGIALRDVLADLDTLRAARSGDASSSLRLALRMVEVPTAMGAYALAGTHCRTLLADEPIYREQNLARIRIAQGDVAGALPGLEASAALGYFWTQVDLVDALSRIADPRSETFQAAYDEAVARMRPGRVDCVFDRPGIVRLIEARRRWHERRGDALGAVRAADALAFATR